MIEYIHHVNSLGKCANPKVAIENFRKLMSGKSYKITIAEVNKRSLNQNEYYWSCVVPMVKDGLRDIGYDDVRDNSDAHAILKHIFLKKVYSNKKIPFEVEGSTTELTKIEFMEYIDKIVRFAAEYLHVIIPEPNTQKDLF